MLREPINVRTGEGLEKKTLLGFNRSHEKHKNTIHLSHPESPDRIHQIEKTLAESGLLKRCQVKEKFLETDYQEIRLNHSMPMVDTILNSENLSQKEINSLCKRHDSVFMTPDTAAAAKEAVACVRQLTTDIITNNAVNGFAFVRPPGHHADVFSPSGFCIFNNVALAAEEAFLEGADRVLIVDLDVHHGHGTQRKFYDDKRVMYFSIHRYEEGNFWPHLRESDFANIGEGSAKGYNANVPLNETGCGDSDYLSILFNVLLPLANQFDPHFVIVSAGFDSCQGDPLGGMNLTPDGYSHIIYHLKSLAQGRILLVLEGGYNHEVSAVCAHRCVRVLLGHAPFPIELDEKPKESTVKACISLISLLQQYWTVFDYHPSKKTMRQSNWPVLDSSVAYNYVKDEKPENTGDIDQKKLLSIKWNDSLDHPLADTFNTSIYCNEGDAEHYATASVDHPENPYRTERIWRRLKEERLLSQCTEVNSTRVATDEEIRLVHSENLLDELKATTKMNNEELEAESETLDSIYLTRKTLDVARKAVGTVLQSVDDVFENPQEERNAFVVVRPPGHHASHSKSSGFCIFNNVAIATKYAQKKFGSRAKKVLILDWDVHHGNGTQEIFYRDSTVLYISLHRHDRGMFYPMGEPKDYFDIGEGRAVGYSVNIPFSGRRMGDFEYQTAFNKVVMPIAYQFNPDLVFISAGFDAAYDDPLGDYAVTPPTFAYMTYQLCGLASGKVIGVLEGGYNIQSISDSTVAVCEVLINRSMVRRLTEEVEQFALYKRKIQSECIKSLRQVCAKQSLFWNHLEGYQVVIGTVLKYQLGVRKPKRPANRSQPKKEITPLVVEKIEKQFDESLKVGTGKTETPRRSPRIAERDKLVGIEELEKQMKKMDIGM